MADTPLAGVGAHRALVQHLEQHQYRRGRYAGSAPLWGNKRWKTAVRVQPGGPSMVVRMHYTDIVTAHRDGRITLCAGGYWNSPTTSQAMREALYRCGFNGFLFSKNLNGYRNAAITFNGLTYAFYDGITFDHTGSLVSEVQPMRKRVSNRELRKAWAKSVEPAKETFMGLLAMGPDALKAGAFRRVPSDPMLWHTMPADQLVLYFLWLANFHFYHRCVVFSPSAAWGAVRAHAFSHASMTLVVDA